MYIFTSVAILSVWKQEKVENKWFSNFIFSLENHHRNLFYFALFVLMYGICYLDVTTMRREEVEVPTEEELNKIVDIILEETDTIWMFDQKGVAVSIESEDAEAIK